MFFGGVGARVLGGGVWFGLSQDSDPEPLLTSEIVPTGSPSTDSADQELVESLLALRAVTLNVSIFDDPAFRSLKDFGTTIVPEPIGRENPFAPLVPGRTPSPTPPLVR